jgi:TRAP-type C4-dicarboxylate transport system permease small subunit
MANADETGNRVTKGIRWIARIWGGLVVAVALLFLVGYTWNWVAIGTADPYTTEGYPAIENVPPLLMFVAALGSGIAWRWEGLGGAITTVSQLVALPVLLIHWPITDDFPRYLFAPYGTWMIVTIPGILFLVCWWRSRERRPSGKGA